eukprot:scaffold1909_cov131-Skeletonema_marinoi.AAC.2
MALSGERSAAKAQIPPHMSIPSMMRRGGGLYVAYMTIIRVLCPLHRLHRSITVIIRASRLSPSLCLTKGRSLTNVVGNTIYSGKGPGNLSW